VGALVLELGSSLVKGGYAGDDSPKCVFPAYAGYIPEANSTMVGEQPAAEGEAPSASVAASKAKQWYTDMAMLTYRDHMEIKSPTTNGLISDWDAAESLFQHTFRAKLLTDPSEHPMMMAEPAYNTAELREKLCEMMFEKFEVPAFFLSKDAVLSTFAAGRATALVLDCGGSISRVSPVHDGYILKKGVIKNGLGGEALTQYLTRQLQQKQVVVKPHYLLEKKERAGGEGYEVSDISAQLPHVSSSYHDWMVQDIVRDVKESFCKASELRYDPEMFENKPPVAYELPDGNTIEVGPERYLIPELMLQPDLGDDAIRAAAVSEELRGTSGLIKMLEESIHRCDPDIRRELYGSVILTGGSSLYPGLNERIYNELTLKVSQQKVKVIAPQLAIERRFSSWIGGSILASLGTFHQLWMSKKEYEESGATLVEKRCP